MNEPKEVVNANQTRKPSASYAFLIVCGSFMITGILVLAWLGSRPPAKIQNKLVPAVTLDPVVNAPKTLSTNDLIGKKTLLAAMGSNQQVLRKNLEG
ncbi:MAG: hypothetical protein U0930_13145 [Pirellulales bacterium]